MRRTAVLALCFLAVGGCSTTEPQPAPEVGGASLPERRIAVAPYDGVFRDHPRLAREVAALPAAVEEAARAVPDRLGLPLDPDRPRRVVLADRVRDAGVGSRVVAGRRQQEIAVAAGPLAQGRIGARTAALDAMARAAIADLGPGAVPDWFAAGAPLWLTGEWDRALHERLLGPREIPADPSGRIPPIRVGGGGNDPVTSALFLRFLAVEFGAERIPDLGRALAQGAPGPEALRVALGTAPESVPVAFEGFTLRAAGGILENPYVRELRTARALPAAEREVRLAGLSERAGDPFVAAAILEELAIAEFELGAWDQALRILARIERDHAAHALSLDRDRYLFALCFLERGETRAAALRLRTFVAEFPASPFVVEARARLGEIHLQAGRTEEAMAEFSRVAERAGPGPLLTRAAVALGAWEKARHRYAAARDWLRMAPDSAESARLLAEIEAELARGLPPEASRIVTAAVRDLRSEDPDRAERGRAALAAVGSSSAPALLMGMTGDPGDWPVGFADRALALAKGWRTDAADGVLVRLLSAPGPDVGPAALDELLSRGRAPDPLYAATPPASAARRRFEARYGGDRVPPEIVGAASSDDWEERARAAERLARTPGAAAGRFLAGMFDDPSPRVRAAVAISLGARPEAGVADALAAAGRDESPAVRTAAYRAAGARGNWEMVRRGLRDDGDPGARVACAALLLDSGEAGAARAVVDLLGDPDPRVRTAVEPLLRRSEAEGLEAALAGALSAATAPGEAMRLVRIVADRTGTDFGYDPAGSDAERRRVAREFLEFLRRPSEE